MTECTEDSSVDLAAGLLDVFPRLLRRLRADVPLVPQGPHDEQQWRSLAELRGSTGQVALMSILVTRQRATMQDLAGQLAVTPATVTMMVKRLLALGYVDRGHDESDWRLVWISPTERGRQVIGFYIQSRQASLRRRLARLDQEERACLQAALPALNHLIEVDE